MDYSKISTTEFTTSVSRYYSDQERLSELRTEKAILSLEVPLNLNPQSLSKSKKHYYLFLL